MFGRRPFLRSLVLLLAISATLLVSTVAASPAHFHKDNLGGTCDICVIAHLPVVQPVLAAHLFAPAATKTRITVQAVVRPSDPFVQLESTRGPPRAFAFFA
jgi:hypothetical protein